jgi:hypothetical protein
MMDRQRAYLPCPGNNCGDPIEVTLEREAPAAAPLVVVAEVRCRSCGAHVGLGHGWPAAERQAAWDESQAHEAMDGAVAIAGEIDEEC